MHGDTDRTPYGWGTFASRSLVISGGASLIAAQKMRAKLIKIASHMLEAAADDIVLQTASAQVAGTDRADRRSRRWRARPITRPTLQGRDRAGPDRDRQLRSAGHVLQRLPCRHRRGRHRDRRASTIEKFLVAEDAGLIINPMIADGQVHGGVAQGIGNALLEEIIYDETGNILTSTLADYLPPTAREIPPIETASHRNPHRQHRSPRPRASAKAAPSARRRR